MRRILVLSLLAILVVTGGCTCDTNEAPTAYVDLISPTEVSPGEAVTFEGHGTDADGTVVAFRWESSIDEDLSTRASFESSSLSEGEHTIRLKVQDNNGTWSEEVEGTVTVSGEAAGRPAIVSFSASPGSISPGGSSTLSWDVSGATTVSLDQGIGSVPLSGSRAVSPGATTTYTLTATSTAGSATATAAVSVSGGAAGVPVITYFTADPETVAPGGASTLSWSVSNADTVRVGSGSDSLLVDPVGSAVATPGTTTTYTLTATNAAGGVTRTAHVSVAAGGAAGSATIDYFTASPENITAGESSELSWSASNADRAWLGFVAGGIGGTQMVDPVDTKTVSPTETTTYTLTAGDASAEVVVTVEAAPTEEHTVDVPLVGGESGYVFSDGEVGPPPLAVGDLGDNRAMRAFFSFDISGLAGAEISKAELNFTPGIVTGNPWPNLSPMQLCEVHYGDRGLEPGDFHMPATVAAPAFDTKPSGPIDLTDRVQSRIASADPRFQVQCRFARGTDDDGHGDFWWTNASLSVTYTQ